MKSNSLHRLIQAFDKGEQRYCRDVLNQEKSNHSVAKLLLFDSLLAMKFYDSGLLKKLLSKTSIAQNLAVEKNRMFQQMLNLIRTLHINRSGRNDPYSRLEEGKVLVELLLFEEAEEVVLKGLTHAQDAEELLAELALRELLRIIYKNTNKNDLLRHRIDNEYRMEMTSRKLTTLVRYTNINDRAFDYLRRYRVANMNEAKLGMDELVNLPEVQDINLATSLPAQQRFYNIWNFYHSSRNELSQALNALLKVHNLWLANPKRKTLHLTLYINHIGNITGKLISLKRFSEAQGFLSTLEKLDVKGRRLLRMIFSTLEVQYQMYYMNSGDLQMALNREKNVTDGLRKFAGSIKDSVRLTLLYNLAVAHLVSGNSRLALQYFNRIRELGELRDRTDLQGAARLLRLLLLEDMNDTVHFSHYLRNSGMFFTKKDRSYQLETAVYDWLHVQNKLVKKAERRASFGQFADTIHSHIAKGFTGAEEMFIWASAKQRGIKPSTVFKEILAG